MSRSSREVPGLVKIPVVVKGRWKEKTVTTDPPRYIPHQEYSLEFDLRCETELLVVSILYSNGRGQFSKTWRSSAKDEWNLRVLFMPFDWKNSDTVQINFQGAHINVGASKLKEDPRPFVKVPSLAAEQAGTTGSMMTLVEIEATWPFQCCVFCVAKSDTENKRGRWSVKPEITAGIPAGFPFLISGDASGEY